jgi:hypothetical protein
VKTDPGGDMKNVLTGRLAPLTYRDTCIGYDLACCEHTKEWCLEEGYVWQECRSCHCGARCMEPISTE